MNPKIHRNFEIFTPCELPFASLSPARSCRPSPFGRLIAAITQDIPDKSFQLVRYIGWHSNKMRGQRDKRVAEEAKAAGKAVEAEMETLRGGRYRVQATQSTSSPTGT